MTPDFEKYSTSELLEAKKHIDKTAYPDRYKAILLQLEKRKRTPSKKDDALVEQAQGEKREKQFGLVVIRLPMFGLITCKLLSLLFFYYCAKEFYEGYMLEEVTSRGNLRTLSDNPAGYFSKMFLYGTLVFVSFWYLTLGSKLRKLG